LSITDSAIKEYKYFLIT